MNIVCRQCNCEMTAARRGPARFWRCDSCGAHALTDATLHKLLPEAAWTAVWPSLRQATAASAHRCPLCEKAMEQTPELPEAAGIRLDICDTCRVIWLDPTELAKIPKVAVEEDALPPEVARAMAKAEVELMNLAYDAREEAVFGPIRRYATAILFGFIGGMRR